MKIAIASDHAGYEFKEKVKSILAEGGHEVVDFGTDSKSSVDYPDFGLKTARAVAKGEVSYGVNICGTGNGMAIAANKIKGIRAGLALSTEMAYLTRLHNDANVLTLSQMFTPEDQLKSIIETFLSTEFEGGRHRPRIDKISSAES